MPVQEGAVAEHLHVLDYSTFNSTNFWSLHEDSDSLRGPPPFTGVSHMTGLTPTRRTDSGSRSRQAVSSLNPALPQSCGAAAKA